MQGGKTIEKDESEGLSRQEPSLALKNRVCHWVNPIIYIINSKGRRCDKWWLSGLGFFGPTQRCYFGVHWSTNWKIVGDTVWREEGWNYSNIYDV